MDNECVSMARMLLFFFTGMWLGMWTGRHPDYVKEVALVLFYPRRMMNALMTRVMLVKALTVVIIVFCLGEDVLRIASSSPDDFSVKVSEIALIFALMSFGSGWVLTSMSSAYTYLTKLTAYTVAVSFVAFIIINIVEVVDFIYIGGIGNINSIAAVAKAIIVISKFIIIGVTLYAALILAVLTAETKAKDISRASFDLLLFCISLAPALLFQ